MENQEQKPIPETSVTPEQPTKKAKPKWIVPAIIIAGIIIIGAGAWAEYNYWLKLGPPALPEAENQAPTEGGEPIEEHESIDCITYKNEVIGFEFGCPEEGWTMLLLSPEEIRLNKEIIEPMQGGSKDVDFTIIDNKENLFLEDYFTKNWGKCIISLERLTINENEAVRVVTKCSTTIFIYFVFSRNQKLFLFSTISNESEMKEIASTFKFIEASDNCAKEGESPTYLDLTTGLEVPDGKYCCTGLKAISPKTPKTQLEEGMCIKITGSLGICRPCGDGFCNSEYEDFCNCPEDCN